MPVSLVPHRLLRDTATLLATTWLPLGAAFAQDVDIALRGPGGASASPLATLSRLGLALVVVLLAFWGCARLMRRLQRVNEAGGAGLRIVGGLSLGQRERLVVVQAGGEQLLLGVSPGRIERLHVLDMPLGAPRETIGTSSVSPVSGGTPEASRSPIGRAVAEPLDFRAKLLAAMQRRVPS